MTENAAIEYLKGLKEDYFQPKRISEALDTVVESLEEVQKYRVLGKIEFLSDMKNHYVEVLSDLRQYQKIGTVEECREAKENKWIPCSEKLPQIGEKVLVCYGVNEREITIAEMSEYKDKKYWSIKSPVHAWQQLPETYPKKRKIHREGEKNKSNHEISRQ